MKALALRFSTLILPLLAFGCGLGKVVGEHQYASASEIKDPRVNDYMPEAATEITLLKESNGHYALYKISEADFHAFFAGVWDQYRENYSVMGPDRGWVTYTEEQIDEALKGQSVGRVVFPDHVSKRGWKPLENAVRYEGPRRQSAAGADYYFDREAGVAYHDAGYW